MTLRSDTFATLTATLLAVVAVPAARAADVLPPRPHPALEGSRGGTVDRSNSLSGYIESRIDGVGLAGSSGTVSMTSLRGSIAADAGGFWRTQWDFGGKAGLDTPVAARAFGGTVHLAYVDPERFGVGVFAGRERARVADHARTYGDFGVEAAGFGERLTVLARAGRSSFARDLHYADVETRVYLHDNFRVDGMVKRFFHGGDNGNLDHLTAALRVNYRPQRSPATFFGGYGYDEGSMGLAGATGSSQGAHRFFAGARASFGSTSLKGEERGGALWSSAGQVVR